MSYAGRNPRNRPHSEEAGSGTAFIILRDPCRTDTKLDGGRRAGPIDRHDGSDRAVPSSGSLHLSSASHRTTSTTATVPLPNASLAPESRSTIQRGRTEGLGAGECDGVQGHDTTTHSVVNCQLQSRLRADEESGAGTTHDEVAHDREREC